MDITREHTPAAPVPLVCAPSTAAVVTGDSEEVVVNEVAIVVSERMDPVTVA